jgi:hypothetical protein
VREPRNLRAQRGRPPGFAVRLDGAPFVLVPSTAPERVGCTEQRACIDIPGVARTVEVINHELIRHGFVRPYSSKVETPAPGQQQRCQNREDGASGLPGRRCRFVLRQLDHARHFVANRMQS